MSAVPPPIDDPDAPDVPEASPPVDGWDTDRLTRELMREESCSYGQAERLLAKLRSEHSLGEIRTLIDRRILDRAV